MKLILISIAALGIAAQVSGVNIIADQKEQTLTNCKVDQTTAAQSFMNYANKKKG